MVEIELGLTSLGMCMTEASLADDPCKPKAYLTGSVFELRSWCTMDKMVTWAECQNMSAAVLVYNVAISQSSLASSKDTVIRFCVWYHPNQLWRIATVTAFFILESCPLTWSCPAYQWEDSLGWRPQRLSGIDHLREWLQGCSNPFSW